MLPIRDLDALPPEVRGAVVAIGNFDGVHRGHACLVERLVAQAKRLGTRAVVFTFDPHPLAVRQPELAGPPLTWLDRRAELLGELGVDAVIGYPTDLELLQQPPETFFQRTVVDKLAARGMVEGADFRFGRERVGDVGQLAELCRRGGIDLEVVTPVKGDGQVISSSRVRVLIATGRVDMAADLLNRPHRMRGTVVRGERRGTGLGFPTANLDSIDVLLPADGIYAGRALVDGRSWPSAVSIGGNPTFDQHLTKVEAHLIDFRGTIYDELIEVDFLRRLRDIERFDSVEALTAQIERDVAATLLSQDEPCRRNP